MARRNPDRQARPQDLFDRMFVQHGPKYPGIAVHTLGAVLSDVAMPDGRTRKDWAKQMGLFSRARTEFYRLCDQVDAGGTTRAQEIEMIALIEEVSRAPDRRRFLKRLGI